MRQVRAQQRDTIDLICWRYYGRSAGVTESVLEANPGLAEHGPQLPHGTLVNLPEIATTQPATAAPVQLWD
ncbi:tail protein X [Motiliproteus sp.]|uniref:tail protein X n=1 Tax=Motiliproteus sp. TaxID=1898955 RepID=UPI003BAB2960